MTTFLQKLKVTFLVSILSLVGVSGAVAQSHPITVIGTSYTQDFNSFPKYQSFWDEWLSGSTRTWQNEVTLAGWSAQLGSSNSTSIEITNGDVSAAGLKSYGTNGYTDNRSMGGLASTTNPFIYQVRFLNSTGKSLTNIGLEFLMQQWFDGAAVSTLAVEFRINEKGITTGAWNQVAAFRAPVALNNGRILDGSLSGNQKLVTDNLEGIVLKANQELTIRWVNAVSSGRDILSIDNFKLTTEEFKNVAPDLGNTGKKVFYSSFWLGSELSNLSSWNTNSLYSKTGWAGDGEAPTSFTDPNQVFVIQKPLFGDHELTKSILLPASSKLVIGNGLLPIEFTIPASVSLKDVNIEVAALAVVNFDSKILPIIGNVDATSTIVYKENSSEVKAGKYGNLKIDNKGAIKKLSSKVLITGQLELKNGAKLDIGDFDLVLGDSKKSILYDAQSFITTKGKGRLKMKLAPGDSAIFPVGFDNKALPVKLKLKAGSAADTFSIKVIDGVYTAYEKNVPNGLAYDNSQMVDKTWIVDEGVVGGTNLEMTLQWTAADMPAGATMPETAFLMHYHNKQWDKGTTTKIVLKDGVYSLTRSDITSFSPFAISGQSAKGTTPAPLPVELTNFQAKRVNQQIQLNWATASEKDNDFFTVEQSTDGVTFQTVGKQVKGAGNSMVALTYSQEVYDANPSKTQYFRLKQTDTDGAFEYSKTVAVAPVKGVAKAQVKVAAYPNPTPTGKVSLEINGTSEAATITVFHSTGKVVSQKQVQVVSGALIELDLADQTAGVYLVQVQTGAAKETLRVVKQ